MSALTVVALLFPGPGWEPMWRFNPPAREGFEKMGAGAVLLLGTVCLACLGAALGILAGKRWAHRLALGILAVNLTADLANALFRGDPRTLIGLPIGGGLIAYLLSRQAREYFAPTGVTTSQAVPASNQPPKR